MVGRRAASTMEAAVLGHSDRTAAEGEQGRAIVDRLRSHWLVEPRRIRWLAVHSLEVLVQDNTPQEEGEEEDSKFRRHRSRPQVA